MFEREIRDLDFVPRWAIVRTVRPQSVANHSYFVAVYTNDLCLLLDVPIKVHLAALQYALCHDWDEIFTGDIPGPHKHKLLRLLTVKNAWTKQIRKWAEKVFPSLGQREGLGFLSDEERKTVKSIVKVADFLDAACFLGTECQIGNSNAQEWFVDQSVSCVDAVVELGKVMDLKEDTVSDVIESVWVAVNASRDGRSRGPSVVMEEEEK